MRISHCRTNRQATPSTRNSRSRIASLRFRRRKPDGDPVRTRYLLMLALAFPVGCTTTKRAEEPPPPSAATPTSAANVTARADGSYVLATFPASGGESTYEVVLAPCGVPACPLQVRLLAGAKVVDTAVVEWPSVVETPRRAEQVAALTGVGDPLELHRTVSTWQTGEGEDAVATVAASVSLGSAYTGLLIHQSGGAEHVKRLHYLFVANGQRLVSAWKGWEGQGLTTSTVDTMDVDHDGRSEILFWRFGSSDGVVSDWALSVQKWNAQQTRADELPATSGGPPVFATIAGTFATPDAAAKLLTEHGNCLRSFLLIRAPEQGAAGFAVAGITAHPLLAAEAVRAVQACDGGIKARTAELGVRRQ